MGEVFVVVKEILDCGVFHAVDFQRSQTFVIDAINCVECQTVVQTDTAALVGADRGQDIVGLLGVSQGRGGNGLVVWLPVTELKSKSFPARFVNTIDRGCGRICHFAVGIGYFPFLSGAGSVVGHIPEIHVAVDMNSHNGFRVLILHKAEAGPHGNRVWPAGKSPLAGSVSLGVNVIVRTR